MNKIVSALIFTLGTAISATAMAAPDYEHRYDDHRYHELHDHDWKREDGRWNDNRERLNPSRDWRVGQPLPRGYDSARFEINAREANRLPRPKRNEQWYKINGDYVLVNERNNRIMHIIN